MDSKNREETDRPPPGNDPANAAAGGACYFNCTCTTGPGLSGWPGMQADAGVLN
jgi:hypothetical protein